MWFGIIKIGVDVTRPGTRKQFWYKVPGNFGERCIKCRGGIHLIISWNERNGSASTNNNQQHKDNKNKCRKSPYFT